MAFLNFARMTVTNTPGNSLAFTLGASVPPYQTFAAAQAVDQISYSYVAVEGTKFEVGHGTYTATGTSLSRDTIYDSSAGLGVAETFTSAVQVYSSPSKVDLNSGSTYVNSGGVLQTTGFYLVDTSSAAFTLTLPASPIRGTNYTFNDASASWGTNNLTIARNGRTIMGQTSDLICNIPDVEFTIWWNNSDWRLN